jgi:hypothetical protein
MKQELEFNRKKFSVVSENLFLERRFACKERNWSLCSYEKR